ncbi:MAG: VWA domain-containing protein, partial [candidate division WOR-3 bacterium]|nr:VWA domain-containing protein [candidate division WOR-3 bacterium]
GLIIFLDLRERSTTGYKLPLFFRILVLIFLILILIGAVFRFNFTRSAKIPILVLIDASKSMASATNQEMVEPLISKIKQTNKRFRVFSFADSVGEMFNYQNPTGLRTNISQALSFAQKHLPGAIVLISDGQHNYGPDPVALAKSSIAPIYPIGLGPKAKNDIAIEQVRHPIRCYQDDTIDISARIKNQGFNNQSVKVSLWARKQLIASQPISFAQSNIIQEVNFRIIAESAGRINYTLRIDSLSDEADYQNNRRNFTIEVLKGRLQIIYFTNSPSFNTRFILSALKADKNFTVLPIISFTGSAVKSLTDQPLDQVFTKADVLILDNVSELQLDNTLKNYLQNWHKQGKGILLLTGENFKPKTFLNEISPFEFDKINIVRKEYFFDLTDEGLVSTLFTTTTGTNILSNAPPLWAICVPTNIKPNTLIWAKSIPDSVPLIGYRKYQDSKVMVITGYPIWRLGFSAIETERSASQFQILLINLMRFLAIKEMENFRLLTNKANYLAGEEIIFNLLATTPNGKPWTNLDIKIPVPNSKISLPLFEIYPGNYQGSIPTLSPGTYEFTAQINQDEKNIGSAKVIVNIMEQSIEDITGLNSDLLQRIAEASNGRYYTYDEFLQETFVPQMAKYQKRWSLAFSYNPYIFIIVVALFSVSLFLRKKRGLL